jgi:hypothetical protein
MLRRQNQNDPVGELGHRDGLVGFTGREGSQNRILKFVADLG